MTRNNVNFCLIIYSVSTILLPTSQVSCTGFYSKKPSFSNRSFFFLYRFTCYRTNYQLRNVRVENVWYIFTIARADRQPMRTMVPGACEIQILLEVNWMEWVPPIKMSL